MAAASADPCRSTRFLQFLRHDSASLRLAARMASSLPLPGRNFSKESSWGARNYELRPNHSAKSPLTTATRKNQRRSWRLCRMLAAGQSCSATSSSLPQGKAEEGPTAPSSVIRSIRQVLSRRELPLVARTVLDKPRNKRVRLSEHKSSFDHAPILRSLSSQSAKRVAGSKTASVHNRVIGADEKSALLISRCDGEREGVAAGSV